MSVLAVLAPEDDGAAASNLHLRAVPEPHGPCCAALKLKEGHLGAGHVIASPEVQVPPLLQLAAHSSEMDLGARLVEGDGL